MEYSAYAFDFDYTLGDATAGIVLCVNGALEQMNLAPRSRDEIRGTVGLSLTDTFHCLTKQQDSAQSALFARLFKEKADQVMVENTELFQDTIPILQILKGYGIRIAIVTTKYHYRIDQIMERFRIQNLIDVIVGCEDVKRTKPDPEGLLFVMKKFEVPEEKFIYIGDSTVDAETAQAAGANFIAVTTGTTRREAFLNYPYKRILNRLSELAE